MSAKREPDNPAEPEQLRAVEELIPSCVLGAAEPEEMATLLRHAAAPPVSESLAAYSRLAEGLLYAVPSVEPPAALAARLRGALQTQAAEMPEVEMQAAAVEAQRAESVGAAAAAPVAAGRAWHWPRVVALAAAAFAVLLLLLNFYWLREIAALRASHEALQQQLRQQTDEFMVHMLEQENILIAQQQQILRQDELVGTLMADSGERFTMQPVEADSAAIAQVAWLAGSNVAVLRAQNFPILEEGKQYQLWLISGDERTSGGVFTVDDYGCANILFHPERSLETFDGMGITAEPAGGSPGPTAPPIVRSQL